MLISKYTFLSLNKNVGQNFEIFSFAHIKAKKIDKFFLFLQFIYARDIESGNPKFFALVVTSELKIIGTLPEAGNLKPNIWWNHQAPARKTRAVFWRKSK